MTYEDATKRISELVKLLKTGKISKEEEAELARLKLEFPKRGKQGGNDFSFWNKFPILLKDAANIAYNFIPGTAFNTAADEYKFANMMVVKYMPTPGICADSTDAFNLWSRELYLELHRKYRGLGAYSWEDLAIIIWCILDVFGRIAEAEFVYAILNYYPVDNRIRPEGVLLAMGFSGMFINTVKSNLADFRYQINYLIMKSAQLCLPKGMTYLKNRVSLNAFMYADSKSKRASYIKFVQQYAFQYNATLPSGSAAIGYDRHVNSHVNYVTYLNSIAADLEILLSDTDVARVCSDLLAALGDGSVDKLQPLMENYNLTTVYDDPILSKVHNLEDVADADDDIAVGSEIFSTADKTALGLIPSWTDGECVLMCQHDGNVVFSVQIANNQTGATYHKRRSTDFYGFGVIADNSADTVAKILPSTQHMIDSWQETPDQATIAEACLWKRNINHIAFEDSSTPVKTIAQAAVTSCGPELVMSYEVCSVVYGQVNHTEYPTSVYIGTSIGKLKMTYLTKFDWHPLMYIATGGIYTNSHFKLSNPDIIGDLDNVAPVNEETVKRIHDACLLSSFVFDGQTFGK